MTDNHPVIRRMYKTKTLSVINRNLLKSNTSKCPIIKTTLFAKNNLISALTAQHNDVKISVGQLLIPIANDSAQARGLREERSD